MRIKALATLFLLAAAPLVHALDAQTYELTISGHRFEPAELKVPVQTPIKLVVHNRDANFEEFHSDSLHREKIIGPNKDGIIKLGPLPVGSYSFMGEFHADTAQGRIIVE